MILAFILACLFSFQRGKFLFIFIYLSFTFCSLAFYLESYSNSFLVHPSNSILEGCVIKSKLDVQACEKYITDSIGNKNNTVTRCCTKWYYYNCQEKGMSKHCEPEKMNAILSVLNLDKVGFATTECKEYPNKATCDRYYILYYIILWSSILIPVLILISIAFLILFFCKCCQCKKSSPVIKQV